MAASYTSTSLPIRGSIASSRPASLSVSLGSINSYDLLDSWSKAIERFNSILTKDESKKIDLTRFPRAEFADFLIAANAAKEKVAQKRHSWTGSLQSVFRHINRYAVIGDIIIQHHAEYTSLVWGAFRFLLLFAVEEHNSSEELSNALETIIHIVFRAEEYAKLFSTPSGSSTDQVFRSLHENLVRLFAEILNFLVRSTRFFEKRTLSRFVSAGISPFDTKFQSILKRIETYERDIEKDKCLLESEARKAQQEYDNGVWLKHTGFETDLQKLQQVRIPGTCKWLLKSHVYLEWRDSSSASRDFLWIQGKPGSGKSVLASQIVKDLHSTRGCVVYAFCKNGDENKNTLESVLRNLVFELLEWSPRKQAFHRLVLNARLNEKSQYAQSIEVLWNLLAQMVNETNAVHCLIDGLDECHSSKSERVLFLGRLVEIFKQGPSCVKLVLISQLDLSESGDYQPLWKEFPIQTSSVQDDIKLLATTRINESKVLAIHPEKDNLLKQLVARSNGMILWTELMIKELEAGHWNIQNVLQKPPEGLFEIWRSIIQRISHSRIISEKISHALQIVTAAARPLRHKELALGLAVTQGLYQHEDYDVRGDAVVEGRLAVQALSPLLTSMPDDTVQLTHASLKDYLTFSGFNEEDAHVQMSEVLIKYMSFQIFQAPLTEQLQSRHFLLEYATRWLVYHSTRTKVSTQTAEQLVVFFDTAQGWKWLQRLSDTYDMSFGHLQLLQSDLASWAQLSRFSSEIVYTLSNFLLILAENRYKTTKSLSHDNNLLLKSMSYLAYTYRELGQPSRAKELQAQVVAIERKTLGEEHPHTLNSMSNLATTFIGQRQWKEAEELYLRVLETQKKVQGAEHPDMLTSMNNLALICTYQGRWKEAEELHVQTLDIQKRVLGAEHLDTLTSMNNLALTFTYQGRWKEAEELHVQVLETSKRVLGAEHPDTLTSMENLASTYMSQGHQNEAVELLEKVIGLRSKTIGPDHPHTVKLVSLLEKWSST